MDKIIEAHPAGNIYQKRKCHDCGCPLFLKKCVKCGSKFWTRSPWCRSRCQSCTVTHKNSKTWIVCNECGKIFSLPWFKVEAGRGKFCTPECRMKAGPSRFKKFKTIFASEKEVGSVNAIEKTEFPSCKRCGKMLIIDPHKCNNCGETQ